MCEEKEVEFIMKIIENFDNSSGEWVYSEIFDKYYDIPNLYVNRKTLEIVQIRNVQSCVYTKILGI